MKVSLFINALIPTKQIKAADNPWRDGVASRLFVWEATLFEELLSKIPLNYQAFIPDALDGTVSVISVPDWQVVDTLTVGEEAYNRN